MIKNKAIKIRCASVKVFEEMFERNINQKRNMPFLVKREVAFLACFRGAKEDRTPDLLTASQTLSQLSYSPKIIISLLLLTKELLRS